MLMGAEWFLFQPSHFTEPIVSRKALCASTEPTPYHTASQRVWTTVSWWFLGLRVAMFQCGYKNPLAVWIDKCSAKWNFPQFHKTERIFIVSYDDELGHQRWLWCYLCWLSGTCWSLPEPWILWALDFLRLSQGQISRPLLVYLWVSCHHTVPSSPVQVHFSRWLSNPSFLLWLLPWL